MDRKERLNHAYRYLVGQNLISSQVELAEKMDASESTISSAFNGNERALTNRFLKRFNSAFGNIFNIEWLYEGEGEMLKQLSDIDIDIRLDGNSQLALKDINNIGDAKIQIILLQEKIKSLQKEIKTNKEIYERELIEKKEFFYKELEGKNNEIASLKARISDLQDFNNYLMGKK